MSEQDISGVQETESVNSPTKTSDETTKLQETEEKETVTTTLTENQVEDLDTQETEEKETVTTTLTENQVENNNLPENLDTSAGDSFTETPQEMLDRSLRESQTMIINSEGTPLRVMEENHSIIPAESENAKGPPNTAFGFGNPDQKGLLQLLKYYHEHPEEKPPLHVKRMVGLLRLHKEDEERREARRDAGYDTDTDDSSDLFYASDESVEYSSELFEGLDGKDRDPSKTSQSSTQGLDPKLSVADLISSSKYGIRMPNCYIRDRCLRDIDIANLNGNHLQIHLRNRTSVVEIELPSGYDGNEILKSFENWLQAHRL